MIREVIVFMYAQIFLNERIQRKSLLTDKISLN
jgi:hypothetical protein